MDSWITITCDVQTFKFCKDEWDSLQFMMSLYITTAEVNTKSTETHAIFGATSWCYIYRKWLQWDDIYGHDKLKHIAHS